MDKIVAGLMVFFLIAVMAAGALALGGLILSASWAVFAPAFGWPMLTWWQAFCALVALGTLGGASGLSRTVASRKE